MKEERKQIKTKYKIIKDQLKGKIELIKEIYKSSEITIDGSPLKLDKNTLLIIRLKEHVQELKDLLTAKN